MNTRKIPLVLFSILAFVCILFISCKKDKDKDKVKIALISGLGGFDDKNFNQSALMGFQEAIAQYDFVGETRESFTLSDLNANIDYFAARDFDLVITVGYNFNEPVMSASAKYPGIDFMILDFEYAHTPDNVSCFVYGIDEVSFPAGVLAAFWADLNDPFDPVVGFVAGPDSNTSKQFSVSYQNGVDYYNTKYGKDVQKEGQYTSSYVDTAQGYLAAEQLITGQGADVIFPFAGMSGNGALYCAKAHGKWGIGVDVDQYVSLPQIGSILLTSCMKRIDFTVYMAIADYLDGVFPGGGVGHCQLSGNGVALAPYHDYDTQIPDSIKSLLIQVQNDIMSGTLQTGWKE